MASGPPGPPGTPGEPRGPPGTPKIEKSQIFRFRVGWGGGGGA